MSQHEIYQEAGLRVFRSEQTWALICKVLGVKCPMPYFAIEAFTGIIVGREHTGLLWTTSSKKSNSNLGLR